MAVEPRVMGTTAILFLPPAGHGDQDHSLAPRLLADAAARLGIIRISDEPLRVALEQLGR